MIAFSKSLGELAGDDILLWREAGLDPQIDLAEAEAMAGWPRGLARAVARIWSCRTSDANAGDVARTTDRSDLRASFPDDPSASRQSLTP